MPAKTTIDPYLYEINKEFYSWTVISKPFNKRNGLTIKKSVKCRCVCGAEKDVNIWALVKNESKSCGCRQYLYIETNKKWKGTLAQDGKKKCCKCKETKDLDCFYPKKDRPDKLYNQCKDCQKTQIKYSQITSSYGLSKQDYIKRQERDNICDCCGKEVKKLVIDHCHKTDLVRGFVCHKCNTGIGLLGDNSIGLRIALVYLEKFENDT